MNIKQIVDKIIKEADIQANNYSVADRVDDVNAEYLYRIEKASQIGSKIPISKGETNSETFTVVAGSNTFTRTIKNAQILRVDFKPTGGSYYEKVEQDQSRMIGAFCLSDMRFFANEKQILVEEGQPGTLRVTYEHGTVTLFTAADYAEATPPSPDFLPEVFHPLLWLGPALRQSQYYKKDRVAAFQDQFDRLEKLFENRYRRNAIFDSEIETDDHNRGNYR